MMNIIAASRLRKSPFVASLFIGGVDAIKYADAASFSDNFKAQHDPTNPLIIPVSNILNYQTEPDGNGRLNISAEIAGNFIIPDQVFDNNISDSGSRITYFVDSQGLATELGFRLFDSNPNFIFLLTDKILTIKGFWLSFTIANVPRVLNFEDAVNIENSAFINYRNPNDRINIRNATNIIADPEIDNIFNNYNLNNRTEPKKVIYVHPSLETINNGSPLNSLQSAISRGADVRYVTNKSLPSNFESGDVVISEISATYLDFTITTPASSNNIDYYDVFILDISNSTDVIRRFSPFQEITDTNTLLTGLEVNKNYKVEIQAVDVFFNKNKRFDLGTITTLNNDITITEVTTGGNYIEFSINNTTPFTIIETQVYVDGVLNKISNKYAVNLNELTSYNINVITKTSEGIDLISNTINVITTTTPALFQNAVAYYKLDETSGDAIDVVSGYNGTLFGGVMQGVNGKIGTAYSFDGSSGYVNTTLNKIGVNSFTVGCWFRTSQTSGISRVLSFRGNGVLGSKNGFQISPDFDSNNWSNTAIEDGNGNAILFTAPLNENDGNWHLVILRFDSSTGEANLIIDNTIVETITEPNLIGFNVTGHPLSIAAATESLGQFYQGEIDEIFIQQTKLDFIEINDLYNNGLGTTI